MNAITGAVRSLLFAAATAFLVAGFGAASPAHAQAGTSGYNTDETEADYIAKRFAGVISKPYRLPGPDESIGTGVCLKSSGNYHH